MSERGRFITLEGGEGVGKSTQVRALAEALKQHGIDVLVTREPGGSDGAEAIRDLLLSGNEERWGPQAEALLFAAARADHVYKMIQPALEAGKWVVSDRFVDSSLAYQGGAGGLGIETVREINAFAIGGWFLGEISKKFGVTPGGTIRGYVFNDLNANGVQDSGELGLANFRVWIDLDSDGVLDDNEPTTHTNSAGRYVIADLLP